MIDDTNEKYEIYTITLTFIIVIVPNIISIIIM